ncbi:MAG: putative ABC transporter permease [Clostridia bacterium]|nr:putative ABC transporter permease [Clostridia bacterium]
MNFVDGMLVAAFLFFIGSVIGWCIEVIFRRCCTAKKWINPGFLTGPYLPLYGFGTAGLFAISRLPVDTGMYWLDSLIIIAVMGVAMTLIEYIAGLIFIKGLKIKLWDYTNRWGNIQGIICPLFSLFWLLVCAFFYFVISPYCIDAVVWFVNHIAFAFFVGLFFGVFLVDLGHSVNITAKITSFAKKHNIVVSLEKLKESIKSKAERLGKKTGFVFPFKNSENLSTELDDYKNEQEVSTTRDGAE